MHGERDSDADSDEVPAYRTIRVAPVVEPVAAMADEEAWRARERYPVLMGFRPVFGVARERQEGGWQLLPSFGAPTPQTARDSLASHFRRRAHEAEEAGEAETCAACRAAAERLDWEPLDELTVLGDRYRVVRAENVIRAGRDGPEPPRPSDPDPAEPGAGGRLPDRTEGFVLDTVIPTGPSEGVLKAELLALAHREGDPPQVRADARRAAVTHPGGVLLPPAFLFAEQEGGAWRSETGDSGTPQEARDALTMLLRVLAPAMQGLDEETRAVYKEAADRLDAERGVELSFAGRHLRLVRVERFVRIGPDGPEGPRPSDYDPDEPVMVQDQRLRAEGGLVEDDEDEEEQDPEFAARVELLRRLSEEEIARRGRKRAR
ncbi:MULTISPECIES: DUF5954 family protein [Streptomyces]|uniref:DUF5954 family protein n=1 Tax=Streptomyces TaxID=1883 RepID=UPI0004C149F9|nr:MULTISPECIES: DUF5954 family protein [Streptomyces]KPC90959.1 PE-PGRS family protein [Streptomyces sp. NRRL F-6602]MDI6408471.1 DUF5954 family protein [Streptomyces albus]